MQWPEEDKEYSGFSRAPARTPSSPTALQMDLYQLELSGCMDNKKEESQQDIFTTNCSSPLERKLPYMESREYLERAYMLNYQDPKPPKRTVTKKRPELVTSSPLVRNQSVETPRLIGSPYGPPPSPEILTEYLPQYVFNLILPLDRSDQTTQLVKELKKQLRFFGDLQELVNQDKRGRKLDRRLILSVLDPSSGMVTRVKSMLSAMNFVELSTFPTFLDGVIGTQCVLKLKVLADPSALRRSGSRRIWTQDVGTQTLMN